MAAEPDGETEPARFARQSYLIAPGLIAPEMSGYLWNYASMMIACGQMRISVDRIARAVSQYGDAAFEALLETLRPKVEALTGIALHPTYSYFRMYLNGSILPRHRDRPACEISVSLNLGQTPDTPWPLYVEDSDGATRVAHLHPGDALVYRGITQAHWREPYEGKQLAQVFLHYVDRDGPHAAHKFDRRATLMRAAVEDGGHRQ